MTMEINDEGLPIHEDATFKLRPRLFLEGNLFVDLQPGQPERREVDDGHTFPINQTSDSVQLDQVLTTLQWDVRADLQIFLNQFGNALVKYGGAEGFRELYRTSPGAYKYTSQVNQALLGTQPHDLSASSRNLDSRRPRRSTPNETGAPGPGHQLPHRHRLVRGPGPGARARRSRSCPTLLEVGQAGVRDLNASFPPLRAFAREALPGVRSTPETLDAATPFVDQSGRWSRSPSCAA